MQNVYINDWVDDVRTLENLANWGKKKKIQKSINLNDSSSSM